MTIRVKCPPERRTKDPLCTDDGKSEVILVGNLVGLIIYANLTTDTAAADAKWDCRLANDVIVLSKTAERYIHILEALAEYIHACTVVTVVLIEVHRRLREGLEVTVIVLYAGFVDDDFRVLDIVYAYVRLSVQFVSASDRNIAIYVDAAFKILRAEHKPGKGVIVTFAQLNDKRLLKRLAREPCGHSGFTGAGDTKIDVEDMGMLVNTKDIEEHNGQDQEKQNFEDHVSLHI